MDMLDFAREIVYCEREYYALSERFRAQVTFQQFVSIKNHRWSKDEVTHWVGIAEENRAREARWKEAQINPTPIRSRELCYSCKEPWEPDHRCRGKGKVHIVEVHYDSEDEEMYEDATVDAYLEQFDDASDSCASEGQLDGQDDNTCSLSSTSGSVEDSTLQHSGDTCEDSHMLTLRYDEIRRSDDLPLGVDMDFRESCVEEMSFL
jgi:hypothetical protein